MNGSAAVCLLSVMKVHVGRADSLLKLKFLEQLEPRVYRATKKKRVWNVHMWGLWKQAFEITLYEPELEIETKNAI